MLGIGVRQGLGARVLGGQAGPVHPVLVAALQDGLQGPLGPHGAPLGVVGAGHHVVQGDLAVGPGVELGAAHHGALHGGRLGLQPLGTGAHRGAGVRHPVDAQFLPRLGAGHHGTPTAGVAVQHGVHGVLGAVHDGARHTGAGVQGGVPGPAADHVLVGQVVGSGRGAVGAQGLGAKDGGGPGVGDAQGLGGGAEHPVLGVASGQAVDEGVLDGLGCLGGQGQHQVVPENRSIGQVAHQVLQRLSLATGDRCAHTDIALPAVARKQQRKGRIQ